MMIFLGIIIGLLIAILVFSILSFFRSRIEKAMVITGQAIESAGPREKGAIFIPEEDIEIERQEIINKNRKEGRDTPLSDLI